MKQRNPLAATLLSALIPFYTLYWLYVTGKIMQSKGAKVPSFVLLYGPILLLFALVFISMFTATTSGSAKQTGNIVVLLLTMVGVLGVVICSILYFWRFSDAAGQSSQGKVDKLVAFILFMIISPVAVYIIQDALNNTTTSTQTSLPNHETPSSTTPPSPPAPSV